MMSKKVTRGRAYNQPADVLDFDTWEWMVEGVAKIKWKDTWFFGKYDYGGLPPTFNKVNYWSTGIGFAFE